MKSKKANDALLRTIEHAARTVVGAELASERLQQRLQKYVGQHIEPMIVRTVEAAWEREVAVSTEVILRTVREEITRLRKETPNLPRVEFTMVIGGSGAGEQGGSGSPGDGNQDPPG